MNSSPPAPLSELDINAFRPDCGIIRYFEGSFGALIMLICVLLSLLFLCFGRRRPALMYFMLSILCFTTRSLFPSKFSDAALGHLAFIGLNTYLWRLRFIPRWFYLFIISLTLAYAVFLYHHHYENPNFANCVRNLR